MHIEKKTLRNIFIGVILCIFVYWLLHETAKVSAVFSFVKSVFSPFVTGAAIAFILNVPMRAIEGWFKKIPNHSLRRVLAIVLTCIFILLILAVVFVLLIPQLVETTEILIPQLRDFFLGVEKWLNQFLSNNPDLLEWATNVGLMGLDWAGLAEKLFTLLSNSLTTILSGTFSAISVVASFFVNLVISIVFGIYCLFQKETLARQGRKLLYAIIPETAADETIRILRMSNSTFSNFLSGQCIEVLILGAMFAIAMAIFRMPYIPLVSVLVAVTAFIPIVGAFVGCIIGAFLIFVNDPLQALIFIAMFLVIQQIEGNLIYPKVVGTSIGLSGMWVLLSVAVGGALFGVAGMFLMIPLTSVLFTLVKEFATKRVEERGISEDKLTPQPPILRSRITEQREKWKKDNIKGEPKDTPEAEENK